jgi:hypothetical protein
MGMDVLPEVSANTFCNRKTSNFCPGRIEKCPIACSIGLENYFFDIVNDRPILILSLAVLVVLALA